MPCLSYYCLYSPTKLEIRAEQILPESEGKREGIGVRRRNGPNNACTYE
jgi:hypothetical protein